MLSEELVDLVKETQRLKTEQQALEIKSAHEGCPKRLYDTLSAFSNQDDGGTILFGIDENQDFKVVGVYDIHDLQKHVNEQCLAMNPPVRPLFSIAEINGMPVVSAEIPGIDPTERPCFYKGKGRLKGSYKRVGESDEPMTEYEIYSYEAFRKKYQDDIRIIPECTFESLDPSALANYILRLKASKPHLAKLPDEQIYSLMSIVKKDGITLAAQWLFGFYPQAFIPQLCITAVKVFGREMGTLSPEGNRFEDNKRIEGTIPAMLEECLTFIRTNLKVSTSIDPKTAQRIDTPQLPLVAIREIILNALIHRDYSIHTEGMPIQVVLYSDRLEVINPGGLYGRLTVDKLGKTQPDTRNPVIATAMETLGLTENRYSGIPTVRRLMSEADLPEPEFVDSGSQFKVVLRMENALTEKSISDNTSTRKKFSSDSRQTKIKPSERIQAVLELCQTPQSQKIIADYLGLSSAYVNRLIIQPLLTSGKLEMTIPEKPKSKFQKYITAK